MDDEWIKNVNEYDVDYWYRSADNNFSYLNPKGNELEKQGWLKHKSTSHQQYYWHNIYSDETSWSKPLVHSARVAIIVPFRDLHVEQQRSAHLRRFIEYMSKYMESAFVPFKIFIIEQSDDNLKFNRGKLLNVGYVLARQEQYDTFIFHDVDLLPSLNLITSYRIQPKDNSPLHIARVWNRYNNNPKYFGGIVSFSAEQFARINGFPNNFWGWGGEDDEMMNRVAEVGMSRVAPLVGDIEDMEQMSIETKIALLRSHQEWKCQKKLELLKEHDTTWKYNGLFNLGNANDMIQKSVELGKHCTKITVAIGLSSNDHWSNQEAALDYVNK